MVRLAAGLESRPFKIALITGCLEGVFSGELHLTRLEQKGARRGGVAGKDTVLVDPEVAAGSVGLHGCEAVCVDDVEDFNRKPQLLLAPGVEGFDRPSSMER